MRTVAKSLKNSSSSDISDIFNKMIGVGAIDRTIIDPKIKEILAQLNRITKILSIFIKGFDGNTIIGETKDIQVFKDKLDIFINGLQTKFFDDQSISLTDLSTYYHEIFKKSEEISEIILSCNNITTLKKIFMQYESDQKTSTSETMLKYHYKDLVLNSVSNIPTFSFSKINIKYVFSEKTFDDTKKQFFLGILHKFYDASYIIYQKYSAPDINVDNFSDIIQSALKDLQKIPALNRCKTAFSRIQESTELFKGNFTDYYKDFIRTKNSTTIIEHFIIDVSKKGKTDPTLTQEFRLIINHFRKQREQSGHKKDEKSQQIFNMLESQINDLDKKTTNLRKKDDKDLDKDLDKDMNKKEILKE